MAHKALLLLGLINQGKCLAVTHRAVLSTSSSSVAALSSTPGSLSVLTMGCEEPKLVTLSEACPEKSEISWICCRLSFVMRMMILPQGQMCVICVALEGNSSFISKIFQHRV